MQLRNTMGEDTGSLEAPGMAAETHTINIDTVRHRDQAARDVASSSCLAGSAGVTDATTAVAHKKLVHSGRSSASWLQSDQNSNAGVASNSSSRDAPCSPGALPIEHAACIHPPPSCAIDSIPGSSSSSSSNHLQAVPQLPSSGQPAPAAAAASSTGDEYVAIDLGPCSSDDVGSASPGAAAAAVAASAAMPSTSACGTTGSSSSRLQSLLQQLRTPSQLQQLNLDASSARPSTSLTRCSTGLSKCSSTPSLQLRECRICLAADCQEDIVQPCSCSGTVQHAHLECLKAWVAERCSLECELCGKQYRDGVLQQLEPLIDPRKRRARQRSSMRILAGGSGGDLSAAAEGQESSADGEARPHITWARFWIHLGILLILLVAVLYLSLFVNVGSADNFWLMFLWRAITVILPLFLIIRCVAALHAWRQQYMAARR